jgi:hypothetical protein
MGQPVKLRAFCNLDGTTAMRTLNDLQPLPYHLAIREYLKREEPEVWEWFARNRLQNEQSDAVRFELLKSTYRIDRQSSISWYEAAEQAAADLSLDVPVTLYQAQEPVGLNASLAFVPGEAHIVLHGPVAATLAELEFRALLAHELGHLLLWQGWDGDFLIVDQLLSALTHDPRAETPHFASARLFALYTEIFCDRASLLVTGGLLPTVSMLIKVSTGLSEVSAESYLRQAEEIFCQGAAKASELTHPEAFIRARALQLWSDDDPDVDSKTCQMIEGAPALDALDLVTQKRAAEWTRRLIDAMLAWPWMQSEACPGARAAVLRQVRAARGIRSRRRAGLAAGSGAGRALGDGRCGHAGLLLFRAAGFGHGGPRLGGVPLGCRIDDLRPFGMERTIYGTCSAGTAAAQAAAGTDRSGERRSAGQSG